MGEKNEKFWAVRDVPEETRRKIKVYAAEHGLTTAQALEVLVATAPERPTQIVPWVTSISQYISRIRILKRALDRRDHDKSMLYLRTLVELFITDVKKDRPSIQNADALYELEELREALSSEQQLDEQDANRVDSTSTS